MTLHPVTIATPDMVTTAAAQLANNVHQTHTTTLSPQLLKTVILRSVHLVRVVGQTWALTTSRMTAWSVQLVPFQTTMMKVNVNLFQMVVNAPLRERVVGVKKRPPVRRINILLVGQHAPTIPRQSLVTVLMAKRLL